MSEKDMSQFCERRGRMPNGAHLVSFRAPLLQTAAFAAVVLVVVQQLDGLLISPRVMGALTGLGPAAVLVGVFAGGCALGVPGMLLALPAMMVFRTCVRVFVQRDENI